MAVIPDKMILDQIPGCLAWKDTALKYLGANQQLLDSMSICHMDQLIGRRDTDLAINSPDISAFFENQDKAVLQGQSIEILHDMAGSVADKTYFLKKSPLYDQMQQIIGIIYHCTPWSANLLTLLKKVDARYHYADAVPNYYSLNDSNNPAQLSERELECVFLLLRSKTAKQIAEILGLSKRTIESYIENIKSKLGCQSKAELLVNAMQQGYQYYLPKRFSQQDLENFFS